MRWHWSEVEKDPVRSQRSQQKNEGEGARVWLMCRVCVCVFVCVCFTLCLGQGCITMQYVMFLYVCMLDHAGNYKSFTYQRKKLGFGFGLQILGGKKKKKKRKEKKERKKSNTDVWQLPYLIATTIHTHSATNMQP